MRRFAPDAGVAPRLKGVTGFPVSARSPKTLAPLSSFHPCHRTLKPGSALQRRRASIDRATLHPPGYETGTRREYLSDRMLIAVKALRRSFRFNRVTGT